MAVGWRLHLALMLLPLPAFLCRLSRKNRRKLADSHAGDKVRSQRARGNDFKEDFRNEEESAGESCHAEKQGCVM